MTEAALAPSPLAHPEPSPPEATGERLIVAYKLVKALVQATLGVGLIVAAAAGFAHPLHSLAVHLREHATAAFSVALAEKLVTVSTRRSLFIASAALLIDACVSGFEGWALRRGFWWGAWLIVLATSAFVPWEVVSMARHFSTWRFILLFANILIVVYLIYRRLLERRRRRQSGW